MPIKPDDEDYAAAAADPMNQGRPDGEMYRFAQMHKIMRLFERAHGRPGRGPEELDAWIAAGGLNRR